MSDVQRFNLYTLCLLLVLAAIIVAGCAPSGYSFRAYQHSYLIQSGFVEISPENYSMTVGKVSVWAMPKTNDNGTRSWRTGGVLYGYFDSAWTVAFTQDVVERAGEYIAKHSPWTWDEAERCAVIDKVCGRLRPKPDTLATNIRTLEFRPGPTRVDSSGFYLGPTLINDSLIQLRAHARVEQWKREGVLK